MDAKASRAERRMVEAMRNPSTSKRRRNLPRQLWAPLPASPRSFRLSPPAREARASPAPGLDFPGNAVSPRAGSTPPPGPLHAGSRSPRREARWEPEVGAGGSRDTWDRAKHVGRPPRARPAPAPQLAAGSWSFRRGRLHFLVIVASWSQRRAHLCRQGPSPRDPHPPSVAGVRQIKPVRLPGGRDGTWARQRPSHKMTSL